MYREEVRLMKVSVIIPVYNQDVLVKRCLDSIPKRSDIEIIVINDGSTDNTLSVLNEYKKEYSKLKIITYKNNKGVSHARNRGIDRAIGKYIIFIDSDDYIEPDVFNDIVDNDLDFVDIVFYNMIDNNGEEYVVDNHRTMNRVGTFKFVRRDFVGTTRFRVKLQCGEDSLFHTKLMMSNPTFKCTGKLMYHYNFPRKGSLTDLYWRNNNGNKSIN